MTATTSDLTADRLKAMVLGTRMEAPLANALRNVVRSGYDVAREYPVCTMIATDKSTGEIGKCDIILVASQGNSDEYGHCKQAALQLAMQMSDGRRMYTTHRSHIEQIDSKSDSVSVSVQEAPR